jgi:signal transduction histidine kinase
VVPPGDIAQASAHPEDKERVLAEVARAFDPSLREICAAEFRILRADGTVRWVAGRGRVVFDETVTPARPKRFLGVLLDITDRKLVEMELLRAKQDLTLTNVELEKRVHERTGELQEMIIELEHMSYSMIHDMRAPLRAIRGFGEILELDPKSYRSEEARQLLEQMRRACHRMDQLVTGALNYNQAVRSFLPVGPINVLQLLRDLLALHPEFAAPYAEVTLEGRFQWVIGNEAGLAQCFAELMRNAVKFVHPPNLPRVRVWAKQVQNRKPALVGQVNGDSLPANFHGGGNRVRLYFEDNGTGIPERRLRRIFDMFQRAHGPEYPGTGVGLALVRKLIQRMGGSVGVESDEPSGSCFWLELPCPPESQGDDTIPGCGLTSQNRAEAL